MIKAIAIDDEPLALDVIKKLCDAVDFVSLEQRFTDPQSAMDYLDSNTVDLLFLDIRMSSVNGINFYKAINQDTMVIFTTAYSEYAAQGFDVNALDYLLKPIAMQRFISACEKAKKYWHYKTKRDAESLGFIYVRSEYALVKIPLQEINYMETMGDYIKIHQDGKKSVLTLMSMKNMMKLLPAEAFIRVHRSFIVAIAKIDQVRSKKVSIASVELPIGISYEKAFFEVFPSKK